MLTFTNNMKDKKFVKKAEYPGGSEALKDKLFEIKGGIVLSNADRQIAELIESCKRSGSVLSARSAAVLLELMKN